MSVHKFYRLKALITLEQVNTTDVVEKEKKKNKNLLWSGDVNLHGMQMALVMSMWFIFGDD